ncbi:MAG TPA: MFS transporter [Dehalococcoidia bacterium]|nr:MFS transporter [Dehalococcoidia bacterium]
MDKKAFFVLVATMLISMLGFGIVVPLLPIYADQMGATALEIGLINAGFSLALLAALPFMGRLSDRFGRKVFLITGLAILTVASLGFIWAQTPLQLILVRIFQGIGASMHLPIAQAYLGDITPKGEEGKWMGHFSAILFSGMSIGPLFGGVLTDLFSVNTTFLVMAALCLTGLIATIVFLPEVALKTSSEKQGAAFTGLRKSNILKGAFAFQMANGFSMACIMTFLPLFASQNLGLSVSLIGLLIASRTPLALLQSFTGILADKYSRRGLVAIGSAAAIIFIALMPLAGGFWLLLLMHALMSIGIAFAMPANTAYVVEEGRVFGMGASMALFMMAMQIGMGTGPIVLGGIVGWLGIESAFYSAAVILLLGIAAFIWFTRKPSPTIAEAK